ncbi:MAG TPA: M3 family oligoendopeptidase [Gaiellaceae bacterium]|nr:M3 family oligoendopeptidase [Gaiellaceae bacterium]
MTETLSNAAGVRWDLAELCAGADEARARWGELVDWARRYADEYRGRLAELDAAGFRAMLDERDRLEQELARVHFYGHSRESTMAADPETNDLATFARDRLAEIESLLVFADLEWLDLDDDRAEELLAAEQLAPYAHKLRVARQDKPYTLSEPEEQALNARRPVVAAWSALHGRQLATTVIDFDGEPHTIDKLLAYLHREDRDLRLRAIDALYDGLGPRADVLAACYDAIVGDRLGMDRLRGYPHPMAAANMSNELDDDVVDGMIDAIEQHYPLAQRWFGLKARLLGLDRLQLADQYAPLGSARSFSWPEAVEIVRATFERFAPRLAEIFTACVESGHVDAEPREGKVGGAYCGSITKDVLPFVLMNYTDQLTNVTTLAHEFGHGTHFALALDQQAYRSHRTGIAMAEVPSTFAQLLALDHLLERESDADTVLSVVVDRAEGAFPSVFRQTVLARFEQRAYALRAEGKALTSDRLAEVWLEENGRYYGDSVELPGGYRLGWSYIPHFIHARFYTYAYSFAHLVTLCLYSRYRADPEGFAPLYLDFLAAGGSESPIELVARFGLDLRDGSTWDEGFAELDRFVGEAEALAERPAA